MSRRSVARASFAAAMLPFVVAACERETTPPAVQVVTINAADYSFTAPDTIQAGLTRFNLVSAGPSMHHAQLIRIDSGRTFDDLMAAFHNPGPPPVWAVMVGGPNPGAPGDTTAATLGLAAGHYAIICLVPDSMMVPHVALGMGRPLEVVAHDGAMAAEPTADVEMRLSDYAFSLSATPVAGVRTFRVVNDGPQPHEIFIARLDSGATAQGLVDYVDAGMHGPPPAYPLGGISVLAPGMHAYFTANLTPGRYGLWCFVPDSGDGREHVKHGMMQEFTVE